MAIGTTDIGFSTIATEVGLPATNLKLSELTRQQVIINPTNSRQTLIPEKKKNILHFETYHKMNV